MSGKWLCAIAAALATMFGAAAATQRRRRFKHSSMMTTRRCGALCESAAQSRRCRLPGHDRHDLFLRSRRSGRSQAAVHLFQLAAAQGNPPPSSILDSPMSAAKACRRISTRRRNWYTKSAEAGVPYAQYRLGVIAVNVHNNWKTALKWLRPAAAQGLTDGTTMLGIAYERGDGMQAARNWRRNGTRPRPITATRRAIALRRAL